jgi:ankyrin repeat protein
MPANSRWDLIRRLRVNLTNTNNSTPLHVSAQSGNSEATKTLVERGCAINSTNKYGVTPLMVDAEHGKLDIFCFLTEIGADNNIRNTNKN